MRESSRLVKWLDHVLYPGVPDNWDDRIFRELIIEELHPTDRILDLGAGAGIVEEMRFRGLAGQVCGIDPDPRVLENPHLDEAKVATGHSIPYPDDYFDLVFADNVAEHLDRPKEVLREVHRVLKPNGKFLFKTPNRTHYVTMLARLTPLEFHQFFNRLRGRESIDTFPTCYLLNSPSQIRQLAHQIGFDIDGIKLVEGRPEYLRLFLPAYVFGWIYERMVNSAEIFSFLRVLLIANLVKKSPQL